jgi:hypothetical protein
MLCHIHGSEPARIIPSEWEKSDGRRLISENVPNLETATPKI